MSTPVRPVPADLASEDRRWLHDKYEHLSEEEGQLSGSRTYYFAVISSVLFTGLVVLVVNVLSNRSLFAVGATSLGGFGILTSAIWAVLVHRTSDAQALWREAAYRLEEVAPPIPSPVVGAITVHRGSTVDVNLTQPYHVHRERFSPKNPISWLDRRDPSALTQLLPMALVGFWATVIPVVWVWYAVG